MSPELERPLCEVNDCGRPSVGWCDVQWSLVDFMNEVHFAEGCQAELWEWAVAHRPDEQDLKVFTLHMYDWDPPEV